jgi:hypothetical protein
VYLKVSPIRGLRRCKVKGKLSPLFIGPFQILQRVGEVAYRLDLPEQLSDVHNVLHISQLKWGLKPHDKEPLPMDGLDVKENLTITERPIRILDTLTRVTRNWLQGIGLLQCARCNEVIMQRMRQLGRERKS